MTVSVQKLDTASWRRVGRVTGIAGLTTIVLVFVPAIAGSGQEPSFKATATETLTFFRSTNSTLGEFGYFASTVGLVAFLWFVVGLTTLLRRAEGEPAWRSTIAVASGVLLAPMALSGNWQAAAFRADDLDPQIARYAFDESNVAFANAWVVVGSFAICCGWVIVSTGFLPRWLEWLAIASGVGLAVSRISWTNEIWLLPYGMFWLWVIAVAVLLLRRSARGVTEPGPNGAGDGHQHPQASAG